MLQPKFVMIPASIPASVLGVCLAPGYAFATYIAPAVELRDSPEHREGAPTLAQQPDPNDERFLQPTPEPFPPESTDDRVLPDEPSEESDLSSPESDQPESDPSDPDQPEDEPAATLSVTRIDVVGSTVFDEDDFAPITEPLEGQTVTLDELQQAADAITQLYLNNGYLTSRALLVDQVVDDGIVRIQVIEGRLAEIQVDGNQRLNDGYIRRRIELGSKVPLRTDQLEDQLRLLRADPLLENVEASLRAGDRIGESILIVRVTEADPIVGEVRVDNYSPPSVGSERTGLDLGYQNLTGIGDFIGFSYDRTTPGGADIAQFTYRAPVNPMNGTLQLHTIIDRNEVIQEPVSEFDIEGESERYEISFRQPLIRSPREEFALSAGFGYRDGQTFLFGEPFGFGIGPDEDGISRTSVFRFGQDYVRRDVQGAWALRSQFSVGVDLFNATTNDDPVPDGRFLSWLGQAQRVQRIGTSNILIVQLDVQLTPDSLLPSEQFVIGGGQSLRGYRQNVRAGDNGVRFSIENRITLARNEAGESKFQLAPFFDMGAVWNTSNNPNELPEQNFLAGLGVGVLWEPIPNLDVRLDFAVPFINLDDRGENIQDDGIYFSVKYRL
ncbi:MAG: ShlB/FhaC/HecB family hemolysin secretion/activation protein [Elainellaceae cyanobacterium]